MTADTSLYESWVTGVRDWSTDQSVDLSSLPALSADSFTPATYERFLAHLNQAITVMMASWEVALQRSMKHANTEFELGRELVQLRASLARRLELARHPGLPAEIGDALWESACGDIRSIQGNLEQSIASSTSGILDRASSSRNRSDALLAVLRSNSLTAIIEPGYQSNHAALAAAASIPPTTSSAPMRRRIVVE